MAREIEKIFLELLVIENKLSKLEKDSKMGLINTNKSIKYQIELELLRERKKRSYESALDGYVGKQIQSYKYN